MTAEIKANLPPDAQPQSSPCDRSSDDFIRDPVPPSNPTRAKRVESSEDIERALHIAPTRRDRSLHRVVVVLVALVVMCLMMTAIVWWRLLT